jgi:hypothetical protein
VRLLRLPRRAEACTLPPVTNDPPRWRTAAGLAALVALRTALDLVRLLQRPGNARDWEEAYNATAGYFLAATGAWDQLLTVQYARFCGGCTVVGLLGVPAIAVGGDHLLAWKLVALAWNAATLLVGFAAVDRAAGRTAAWATAALLAVPPSGLAEISLLSWGNHAETGLFVLGSFALMRDRPVLAALIAGIGVWFCRTAAYGAVVVVPFAMWAAQDRRARLAIGAAFLAGLAPMLLPAADNADLGYRMGVADNLLPEGLSGLGRRLALLLSPSVLARRLFPWPRGGEALAVAFMGAAFVSVGLLLRSRDPLRVALAMLPLSFAAAFSATGFDVSVVRSLNNVRYWAPWMLVLLVVTAAAAGPLLAGPRRWRGALLLAPAALVAGIGLRPMVGPAFDWAALAEPATDLPTFTRIAERRIPPPRLRELSSDDPRVERALRRMEGSRIAELVRRDIPAAEGVARAAAIGPEALVGLGEGLASAAEAEAELGRWIEVARGLEPATAAAFGDGLSRGAARRFARPGRRREDASDVAEAVRSLGGAASPLAPAAGVVLARVCRQGSPRRIAECLAESGELAVIEGAGRAFGRVGTSETVARIAAGELDRIDPTAAAAFREGLDDPLDALSVSGP